MFILFLTVQIGLMWIGGAFRNEFGGYPDEAGHFITGLMIRDFICSGKIDSPMMFAEQYYIHYPKVAFGHWPPLFHIIQAFWTLLFPATRVSLMILMALITTCLSFTIFMTTRKEFGNKLGITVGLTTMFLPLVMQYSSLLMAEVLVALLSFWAILFFGKYLETQKWKDALYFAILAVLTIMTKGNGLALALVPPFSLLFSQRLRPFTRIQFWIIPLVVVVLCGPFYWLTFDLVRNGWRESTPSLNFTVIAVAYYVQITKITGYTLIPIILIGFVAKIVKPALSGGAEGKWAAIGALVIAVWIFHCVVPSGLEWRHLIPAIPSLMMFLAAGIYWLSKYFLIGSISFNNKVGIIAISVMLIFLIETFKINHNKFIGYSKIAHSLLSNEKYKNSVFLISSDSIGEGVFITEIAMQESRLGHIILRGSKVLGKSLWDGSEYKLIYKTPEEMMKFLEQIPVGIVIVDYSLSMQTKEKHQELLEETLNKFSNRWLYLGSYSLTREGITYHDSVKVYTLIGHQSIRTGTIQIDMGHMLNKKIEIPLEENKN